MLNWWNTLTQDNKVKLIIVILGAVLAVVGYFGEDWFESTKASSGDSQATVTQTTSGDSSPAVSGTKGDVTININTPDQGKKL